MLPPPPGFAPPKPIRSALVLGATIRLGPAGRRGLGSSPVPGWWAALVVASNPGRLCVAGEAMRTVAAAAGPNVAIPTRPRPTSPTSRGASTLAHAAPGTEVLGGASSGPGWAGVGRERRRCSRSPRRSSGAVPGRTRAPMSLPRPRSTSRFRPARVRRGEERKTSAGPLGRGLRRSRRPKGRGRSRRHSSSAVPGRAAGLSLGGRSAGRQVADHRCVGVRCRRGSQGSKKRRPGLRSSVFGRR